MYAAAAIPSVLKTGIGIYQTLRGAFMKEPTRPKLGVMPATQQQVSRAEGMAGRSSDVILESQLSDINRSSANQLGNLTKSVGNTGDILAGLGSIEAQKARSRNQAYGSFGERKYSYENQLLRAYDALRQEQMSAWQWNQQTKYVEDMTKKQALIGSGLSNIGVGASELGTIGTYKAMYPNGGGEDIWGKLNQFNKKTQPEYSSPVY